MNKKRISISWSGGKDSSFMLWSILKKEEYEIVELHTVINTETQRVGLHGVKKNLIEAQAEAIGIPVHFIELDQSETNDKYEAAVKGYFSTLKDRGISGVAFGDIFLEDLKKYRETLLSEFGLEGIYPLWQTDTSKLADEFIKSGFKSIICSSDANKFPFVIAGRNYTPQLVSYFPSNVDPCGENGEFHSFVFNGPIFKYALQVKKNGVTEKGYAYKDQSGEQQTTYFNFCDLEIIS